MLFSSVRKDGCSSPFLISTVAFVECRLSEYASIAYVTFKDTYTLETAILLTVSFCSTLLLC